MLENRLKDLRKERLMSLDEIAKKVGKSVSTISRYENNLVNKLDLELIEKIADVLGTSSAYLLGMTDDTNYIANIEMTKYFTNDGLRNILVTDNRMEPEIPEGSCVQIRDFKTGETLMPGSFYYVKFNNNKCFRMAVHDTVEGAHLMPMDMSEQRIAYDKEYVEIIGKAVSMKVFFEDESNES